MVSNYNEVMHKNQRLETERLLLRKFREEDAADIVEWASDPEAVRWLTWDGLSTEKEAIDAIYNVYLSHDGIYAMELKDGGKCVGCMNMRLETEHEKASFGYVMNRKFWGKGYMTEALRAIIKLCFEKLELNRVEAEHYAVNPASGRVMEKAGMKKEGIARQSKKIKGVMQDCVMYGILREDYFKQGDKN